MECIGRFAMERLASCAGGGARVLSALMHFVTGYWLGVASITARAAVPARRRRAAAGRRDCPQHWRRSRGAAGRAVV